MYLHILFIYNLSYFFYNLCNIMYLFFYRFFKILFSLLLLLFLGGPGCQSTGFGRAFLLRLTAWSVYKQEFYMSTFKFDTAVFLLPQGLSTSSSAGPTLCKHQPFPCKINCIYVTPSSIEEQVTCTTVTYICPYFISLPLKERVMVLKCTESHNDNYIENTIYYTE